MYPVTPTSSEDLAAALQEAAQKRRTISVIGSGTKRLMGGPALGADVTVCTAGLKRIIEYEPNDLTISVEAGHSFAELQETLTRKRQMIALDPPFYAKATIGGVVASNSNGPMRRAFGTARDLVIGMKFAMLNGKIASVGGMVVKNVAGLDIGKLMIGSFGTLGVMTTLNFRLHALPEKTNTFLYSFGDLESALEKRDAVLRSPLRPLALDLISPPAAARLGVAGYVLAIRAGGSKLVLRRYERELSHSDVLTGEDEGTWWSHVREFTADFVRRQPNGVVLRIGTTLTDMGGLLRSVSGAFIARAATGVTYLYLSSWQAVPVFWQSATQNRWSAAIEFAPEESRSTKDLWLLRSAGQSDSSFAMMKKIKQMFDPHNLLNRSRLYGRL
jgi:glycolate oxidase FAD binding subunit